MQFAANIHLGPETRVLAPEWADAFIQIDEGVIAVSIFLGPDDETRITNIDKLAESLLDIRTRCMERMARPNPAALEITESEARAMDGNR